MIRRHMTHVRHTLQETGFDVDGREDVDEVPKVDQVGGCSIVAAYHFVLQYACRVPSPPSLMVVVRAGARREKYPRIL